MGGGGKTSTVPIGIHLGQQKDPQDSIPAGSLTAFPNICHPARSGFDVHSQTDTLYFSLFLCK